MSLFWCFCHTRTLGPRTADISHAVRIQPFHTRQLSRPAAHLHRSAQPQHLEVLGHQFALHNQPATRYRRGLQRALKIIGEPLLPLLSSPIVTPERTLAPVSFHFDSTPFAQERPASGPTHRLRPWLYSTYFAHTSAVGIRHCARSDLTDDLLTHVIAQECLHGILYRTIESGAVDPDLESENRLYFGFAKHRHRRFQAAGFTDDEILRYDGLTAVQVELCPEDLTFVEEACADLIRVFPTTYAVRGIHKEICYAHDPSIAEQLLPNDRKALWRRMGNTAIGRRKINARQYWIEGWLAYLRTPHRLKEIDAGLFAFCREIHEGVIDGSVRSWDDAWKRYPAHLPV